MKKLLSVITVLIFATVGFTSLNAQEVTKNTPKKDTKLYAVKFHADWCGSCQKLTAPLKELKSDLEGKAVEFFVFDFTSDETKEKSRELAEKLGIKDLYDKNQKTGFALIVDAKSKKKLSTISLKHSAKEMLAEV